MVLNSILKKVFYFLPLMVLFFSACSTKEVFEPKVVMGEWNKVKSMKSEIIDRSSNVAQLENQKILTQTQEINTTIPPHERAISVSDGWVISASLDGNLTLQSQNNPSFKKKFFLKKTVAAASVDKNYLAVLFANNEMALYNLQTQELLLKEEGGKSIAVNMNIQNPHFMNGLVIFPTLDGKVVIINIKRKKKLRSVIVSSEDFFNNIIYFNIVDNKIVAASGYKILSLAQKEIHQKYEIRNLVYDKDAIYINTKQGEVVALTPTLDVISKIKFPFAHFLGMIENGGKLYILEKEGYMIVVDKKTFTYNIYEIDLNDGLVFVGKKVFYVDDMEVHTD
jgi:hypothetical protein